jgi:putative acetyltransferase
VATENVRAIELYKKVGFETEGILRKYTYLKREQRFLDELLMSYIFK